MRDLSVRSDQPSFNKRKDYAEIRAALRGSGEHRTADDEQRADDDWTGWRRSPL